jgi:hypothetical protein
MDDMLAVRTLAERLLSLPHDSDAEAEPARVLPGALPDDLPCPVPIPEGVTVIGSVSYPPVQSAYDQRGRRVTILFDTPLQPEDVMAYYHGRLCADGWVDRSKDVETARATAGGFRFVDPPGEWDACFAAVSRDRPYGSLPLPRATQTRRCTWRWT